MSRVYNVIDADGHILEPLDLWDKYMDPKFRDRAPRPSKRSMPTCGMPAEAPSWKPIAMSRSSAAAQNGSYIGSLIILLP